MYSEYLSLGAPTKTCAQVSVCDPNFEYINIVCEDIRDGDYCGSLNRLQKTVDDVAGLWSKSGFTPCGSQDTRLDLCDTDLERGWRNLHYQREFFLYKAGHALERYLGNMFRSLGHFYSDSMRTSAGDEAYNRKIGAGHYGVHF